MRDREVLDGEGSLQIPRREKEGTQKGEEEGHPLVVPNFRAIVFLDDETRLVDVSCRLDFVLRRHFGLISVGY